ncbi:TadE family protein [Streptomyces sp. NPDC052396]|uniref:TadE family protein n=1 Tax=Streptomyces sp. NPDC052396 TaxID=3365689 RepID=UPI0037D2DA4B
MKERSAPGRAQQGQTTVEFIGMLPVLLLIGLAAIQLGLVAYTAEQAGTGARAAARAAARGDAAESAGRAAMSGWLARRARIGVSPGGDEVTATATVEVPSVIGIDLGATISRSVTMPNERPAVTP